MKIRPLLTSFKDKKKKLVFKNTLALLFIFLTLVVFFLSGCTSRYEKAYALKPPPPVMKPIPVSDAVRLIHERETDPDALFDDIENIFVIPPELEL